MPEDTRRHFLQGCASTVAVAGLYASTGGAQSEDGQLTEEEAIEQINAEIESANERLENVEPIEPIDEITESTADELQDEIFTKVVQEINIRSQEQAGMEIADPVSTPEEARAEADEIEENIVPINEDAQEAVEGLRTAADAVETLHDIVAQVVGDTGGAEDDQGDESADDDQDDEPAGDQEDCPDEEPEPEPDDECPDEEPEPEPQDDCPDEDPEPEPQDDCPDEESEPEPQEECPDEEPEPEPQDECPSEEPEPQPQDDCPDEDPEPEPKNDCPDETGSGQAGSERASGEQTNDIDPDDLPEGVSADDVPDDVSADDLPDDISADDIPEDFSADDIPDDIADDIGMSDEEINNIIDEFQGGNGESANSLGTGGNQNQANFWEH